ncbi:MAG: hypothetical protein M1140_06335 [Chloroflexi bacterium]|nr:hypothetical protein [Chloroflexota bacterium]
MSENKSNVDRKHQTLAVRIQAAQQSIPMGRTAQVEAVVETGAGESPREYILLPFVNERRWGAHERPDAQGHATFLLPLPDPGPARVQVLALKSDTTNWMGLDEHVDLLLAGRPMPDTLGARSNTLDLDVTRRAFAAREAGGTLFGVQWEPWFTGGVKRWGAAQAVPLTGFYDSYNRDVTRQHILWCMDIGADFLFADWTNHIWGRQHWSERPPYVNTLLHATQLALEVLAEMRDEGLPVPKMALFPGLSNGKPCTMQALNEELDWIDQNYLRNPRFDGLWQDFDGKPLVVVLDTGAVGDRRGTAESAFRVPFFKQTLEMSAGELDAFRAAQPPVDETRFTVRWMSSQNETTRHHELGYWSWMDGTLEPPVTYRDGQPEAVTASVAIFNTLGWMDKDARGRRGGATYLETLNVALQHRPRVVFLHQFNEYSGQPEGHGMGPNRDIYVDTYNVEFSDDFEPVSLTARGYRGDTGGWGLYYLNLTRALIDLYRGRADDCTLLAVSNPLRNAVISGESLQVAWASAGKPFERVTIAIDGQLVLRDVHGTSAEVPLAGVAAGPHTLTVIADGALTRYPLAWTEFDVRLGEPVAVAVTVPFTRV